MSRKGEINIFGAAFIDLFGIALASQLLASIMNQTQEALPSERQEEVRIFELSQYGHNHLCEGLALRGRTVIKLDFPAEVIIYGTRKELHFRDATKAAEWKQIDTASLEWLEAENGYAGGLRLFVVGRCKPFTGSASASEAAGVLGMFTTCGLNRASSGRLHKPNTFFATAETMHRSRVLLSSPRETSRTLTIEQKTFVRRSTPYPPSSSSPGRISLLAFWKSASRPPARLPSRSRGTRPRRSRHTRKYQARHPEELTYAESNSRTHGCGGSRSFYLRVHWPPD